MTKDDLTTRIAVLDKGMEECVAHFNALKGRRQECVEWVEALEKSEEAKPDGE